MVGQFSLIAVLAVVTVAQVTHGEPADSIENALSPAALGEFPHQVSLRVNGRHICGGAIVGNRHIVTTAKCVMDLPAMIDLLVITGSVSSIDGGNSYSPRIIVIHPDFKRETTGPNDIAIIALKRKIALNDNQQQLFLPWQHTPTGIDATLTGWRWASTDNRTDMEDLMKMPVRTKECSEPTVVGLKEICASVVSGSGNCSRDRGSPLVSDNILIGVLSYGNACDEGTSAVFSSVVYYIGWIFQTIIES